ncbi:hypothetical protein HOF65_07420 [bacterium]|nr:hypothetical protein [bacterium]MBT3853743.1 hypothetical protein [bacterium]
MFRLDSHVPYNISHVDVKFVSKLIITDHVQAIFCFILETVVVLMIFIDPVIEFQALSNTS